MRILILYFFIITIASCQNRAEEEKIDQPEFTSNRLSNEAILKWTGEVAADGCGFLLIMNGTYFKPLNQEIIDADLKIKSKNFDLGLLPAKTDDLIVQVLYETTGQKTSCGMEVGSKPTMPLINIVSILKKSSDN